jgi:hypothetical protein
LEAAVHDDGQGDRKLREADASDAAVDRSQAQASMVLGMNPLSGSSASPSPPNAILMSHTTWYREASVRKLQRKVAEETVRALQGLALRNVVNGAGSGCVAGSSSVALTERCFGNRSV